MTKIWLFIACIEINGLNALGGIASKDSKEKVANLYANLVRLMLIVHMIEIN